MSGLALPRAQAIMHRWPTRPPAIVKARPAVAAAARPEPATLRQRIAGPLALSLLGHAALLAAGLAATLLLPTTPPTPSGSPPAFSVELAIAPTPTAPAQSPPAELSDIAPLPQPPPDALVVPRTADIAAMLPAPEAPPAPATPAASARRPPPAPRLALPPPPPPPLRTRPRTRPAHPAETRRPAIRHAAATASAARPASGPTAAPIPQRQTAEPAPMLIATPRFRTPPRPPVYPRRAVAMHVQGEALIGALLDPSGTPHDVRVLRSSGHPMLDRAALDAVGGWAFEPGRRAGHPVAARVEIPVRFTLR